MGRGLVLAALALGVAACGGDGGSDADEEKTTAIRTWPAPKDPMALAVRAGLQPGRRETLTYHVHAHLDVLVDRQPVLVPAGIGIDVDDPGVRSFTGPFGYGGIELCDRPCISPLHTHDESGVIHTETSTPEPNTLGQFFLEWDVRLDGSCVGEFCRPETTIDVYVDGKERTGDPRSIMLTDKKEIDIVIGKAPQHLPSGYDFSKA